MSGVRGGGCVGLALALALGFVGCKSETTVTLPPLEVVVASGDSQYGTLGQELGHPLRVLVHTLAGEVPQVGATVAWDVVSGDASLVGAATSVTDSTGSAEVRVRLGSAIGPVTVQATALSQNDPTVSFTAYAVDQPELQGLAPVTADPGDLITLSGDNFSPDLAQNVVLFSGIRGVVTSASATELTARVPACLPERSVAVSVQLGTVASGSIPLSVGPGATVVSLPVDGVLNVEDDDGFACLGLAGDADYLVVAYSASTVGAAAYPYRLTGIASQGGAPSAARATAEAAGPTVESTGPPARGARRPLDDPQTLLDRALREQEEALLEARRPGVGAIRLPAFGAPAAAPPVVGERRTFHVYEAADGFAEVTAVARLVSDRAALFVDEAAPSGGFGQSDLQAFADRFDDVIYPVVADRFGSPSDIDGNQRVVILFTPVVNTLTPRGSSGFIGGFFFGIDLMPERDGSNAGEIFYALVPDPAGTYSDPRSLDAVLSVTPAILAHEYQHMVHFNERVTVRTAETADAIWLSEGLAQQAEEEVAREYERLGDADAAELFRTGARIRARRYLDETDAVSLIFGTGQGTLEERGATFLFVLYLEDRYGPSILRDLTRTIRTGVSNVVAEAGDPWPALVADWATALHQDGPGPESGPRVYPDVDLRDYLGSPFPLEPTDLGDDDFGRAGSLWSSSAAYYIVSPPSGGSTALRISGEAGGPSSQQAVLRMRVIRIS